MSAATGKSHASDALPPMHEDTTDILGAWNATVMPYPRDARIEQLVLDRAADAPDKPAIVDGAAFTYGRLATWSAVLAARLSCVGVGSSDVVALHLPRGAAFAASALAILRLGAAYLPVDPDYPDERVSYLLADGDVRAVVAAEAHRARPAFAMAGVRVVDPGDMREPPGRGGTDRPGDADTATDPACILYTSGTTGRPKGVVIPHRALIRIAYDTDHARLGPGTAMAHIAATTFDASAWELWGTLVHGGTVYTVDKESVLDPVELGRAFAEYAITTSLVTSALFSHLADADPGLFSPLTDLLVGGDVLSSAHAHAVLAACPGLRLLNVYGPTENGVLSTVHLVRPGDGPRIPIGRPIRNSTAYVVAEDGTLQRPGIAGELWVGGDGLAVGYHRRPDLTAQAFVDAPFAPGTRLYRTGDRVLQRADGIIEFLGREDHQVKVRGQRVELGEIQQALMELPGIDEAVVLADRSHPGDPVLRGFVTGTADAADIRVKLADRLPDFLIPRAVTVLDRFPLTGHGKVDRAALAALPAKTAGPVAGPAARLSPDEERVAAVWRTVLSVPAVVRHDTVTGLGGSSLAATRIAGILRTEFGRQCRVAWVLKDDLATVTRKIAGQDGATACVTSTVGPDLPLLPQQAAVLAEAIARPGDLGYNLPVVVETSNQLDVSQVRAALDAVMARHGALRTTMVLRSDRTVCQQVRPGTADPVPLDVLQADGDRLDDALRGWVRPFDLEAGPLWRAAIVSGVTRHALALDVHHIVADGWSLRVLFEEISALLSASPPSLRPAPEYAQVVTTAHAGADTPGAAWPALETAIAGERPDLPIDHSRPSLRLTAGDWVRQYLGPQRSTAVRDCARALGAPPFAVYLAALAVVLGRVTGSSKPVVAVPFSGRHVAGGDQAIGMLVVTHALPVPVGAPERFADVVNWVAQAAAEVADQPQRAAIPTRQDRHPVADVLFALQDTGLAAVPVVGGRPQWRPDLTGTVLFDLALHVEPGPDGDYALWGWATAILEPGTVNALHNEFTAVIDAGVAAPATTAVSLGLSDQPAAERPAFSFDL